MCIKACVASGVYGVCVLGACVKEHAVRRVGRVHEAQHIATYTLCEPSLELRNRILVLQQQLPPSSSTATKKPDHSSSSSEQESSCVVKTMVNLGSEFYAQAKL